MHHEHCMNAHMHACPVLLIVCATHARCVPWLPTCVTQHVNLPSIAHQKLDQDCPSWKACFANGLLSTVLIVSDMSPILQARWMFAELHPRSRPTKTMKARATTSSAIPYDEEGSSATEQLPKAGSSNSSSRMNTPVSTTQCRKAHRACFFDIMLS